MSNKSLIGQRLKWFNRKTGNRKVCIRIKNVEIDPVYSRGKKKTWIRFTGKKKKKKKRDMH